MLSCGINCSYFLWQELIDKVFSSVCNIFWTAMDKSFIRFFLSVHSVHCEAHIHYQFTRPRNPLQQVPRRDFSSFFLRFSSQTVYHENPLKSYSSSNVLYIWFNTSIYLMYFYFKFDVEDCWVFYSFYYENLYCRFDVEDFYFKFDVDDFFWIFD